MPCSNLTSAVLGRLACSVGESCYVSLASTGDIEVRGMGSVGLNYALRNATASYQFDPPVVKDYHLGFLRWSAVSHCGHS